MAGAAAGGGGGGNQDSGSVSIFWAIGLIFTILFILWYNYKIYMVDGYLIIKSWEMKSFGFFSHSPAIHSILDDIAAFNPYDEEHLFERTLKIGQRVGTYIRLPLTGLMVILGFVVYFANTTRVFKNIYSMKTLALSERVNWPQISPVVNLDLVKADIDVGPWAMAMTPIQYCKKNKLIEEYRRPRTESMSRKDMDRIEVGLKRGESNKLFALQLGPRWEGVNRLPPYTKALFAVFAARINADTKAAANIILQINQSPPSKFNYTGVEALIKKHENTKIVQHIIQSHAYVLTVMAQMISAARLDGVQATADFLWLKPLDRKLWYVLNSVGRQTPFTEGAGPFSHWLAEKEAGRKLIIPMIEAATNALEVALKSMVYHPDEEQK